MIDVSKAVSELQVKTLQEIETETAYTWASRALAARQLAQSTPNPSWWWDYNTYYSEALEHAVFARPGVLEELRTLLQG